jgi:hypothetical protein
MSSNVLTDLNGQIFSHNIELQIIDFSNNLIPVIPEKTSITGPVQFCD